MSVSDGFLQSFYELLPSSWWPQAAFGRWIVGRPSRTLLPICIGLDKRTGLKAKNASKNMNTTKDMFKMALAVEYMKAVVSDATWIPAVCEAHNVVDGWHIQSKTVVCQRGVKALHAVEAVQKSAQRISAAILHGLFAEKKQSSILTGNTPVPNPDPRQSKEDARQENVDEEQEQQDSEEFGPIQNFGTASLSE